MTSSSIRYYDVIIVILMCRHSIKGKVFVLSLFFDGSGQNLVQDIIFAFSFQIFAQNSESAQNFKNSTFLPFDHGF